MANSKTGKIWMLSSSFYPWIGGAERQIQRVSKLLIAQNYSLKVLTRRHREGLPGDLPAEEIIDSIPVIRLYSRGSSKIGSLLYVLGALWYLICHGRGSIYHAHGPGAPAWLAVIAQYLLGGHSIIKVRSGTCIYTHLYLSSWWRFWLFVVPLRLASRVLVVSRDGAQLVRKLGVPGVRVVRVPNGIDTDLFHPVSQEIKQASRQRLGLPTNKTIVLYVGRLNLAVKDVDTLVRAWAQLPNEVQEGTLLIMVGDGPDREKLLRLIRSLGFEQSILMAGSKQEIRDYYWAADIFTLPSRDEGLSNALLEAMACSLPVVASRVGGTPDIVENGKNGLLYEAEDHQQLAQQLASMIQMGDRWVEMGEQGRKIVTAYASLSVVVERLKELYGLLSQKETWSYHDP